MYDPDIGLTASQGGSLFFRGLTQSGRDLPLVTQQRSLDIAYWLTDTNPMAKRIIETTVDHLLGNGAQVVVTEEDEQQRAVLQEVIKGFWDDGINLMDLKLRDKVLNMRLTGEACWSVQINDSDGHVRLAFIDPGLIRGVVKDPENAEIDREIIIRGRDVLRERRLKVIDIDQDPQHASYGRLVGVLSGDVPLRARSDVYGPLAATGDPQTPEKYDGACFFFPINRTAPSSGRGRSDLLPLADWIDQLDKLLFSEADRMELIRDFIWDVKLQGMSDAQIAEWLAKQKMPKPGSIRAHNESVEWQAVTPNLQQADAQVGFDLIHSYIATGAGIPKTWLNGVMDVNRASAVELAEPAFRHLAAAQKHLKFCLERVVTFVLDQAELAGQLPRREGMHLESWPFEVQLPEIRPKDLITGASALYQASQGLANLRADGGIDQQVEQEVAVVMLEQLGVSVDIADMRERIAQAEAEKAAARAVAPYLPAATNGAGPKGGPPGTGANLTGQRGQGTPSLQQMTGISQGTGY